MKIKLPISLKPSTSWLQLAGLAVALAISGTTGLCQTGKSSQTTLLGTSSSDPWQSNQIIQPETLAKSLAVTAGQKPLVLCVGFRLLYDGAHIVGSKFAGPAAKPEGIEALKREVQGLAHNKEIVLYCGCCPWSHCPNVRPAFRTMQELGFTNVKVLSVPTNFREDWVAKGFPVEKGNGAK